MNYNPEIVPSCHVTAFLQAMNFDSDKNEPRPEPRRACCTRTRKQSLVNDSLNVMPVNDKARDRDRWLKLLRDSNDRIKTVPMLNQAWSLKKQDYFQFQNLRGTKEILVALETESL